MNSDAILRDFTSLVEQAGKRALGCPILITRGQDASAWHLGWVEAACFSGLAFTVSPLMSNYGHEERFLLPLHSFSITQDRLIDLFPASSL